MGRLDAKQFTSRRIKVADYSIKALRHSRGVAETFGTIWYLKYSKRIKIRIKIVKSKTNNGKVISTSWEEDWPAGGDRDLLKAHLAAMVKKYHRKYRAREWPEVGNYRSMCDPSSSKGFVEATCSSCSASYCTVKR